MALSSTMRGATADVMSTFLEDVREENGGPTESQVNTSGKEVVSKSVIPVENP